LNFVNTVNKKRTKQDDKSPVECSRKKFEVNIKWQMGEIQLDLEYNL